MLADLITALTGRKPDRLDASALKPHAASGGRLSSRAEKDGGSESFGGVFQSEARAISADTGGTPDQKPDGDPAALSKGAEESVAHQDARPPDGETFSTRSEAVLAQPSRRHRHASAPQSAMQIAETKGGLSKLSAHKDLEEQVVISDAEIRVMRPNDKAPERIPERPPLSVSQSLLEAAPSTPRSVAETFVEVPLQSVSLRAEADPSRPASKSVAATGPKDAEGLAALRIAPTAVGVAPQDNRMPSTSGSRRAYADEAQPSADLLSKTARADDADRTLSTDVASQKPSATFVPPQVQRSRHPVADTAIPAPYVDTSVPAHSSADGQHRTTGSKVEREGTPLGALEQASHIAREAPRQIQPMQADRVPFDERMQNEAPPRGEPAARDGAVTSRHDAGMRTDRETRLRDTGGGFDHPFGQAEFRNGRATSGKTRVETPQGPTTIGQALAMLRRAEGPLATKGNMPGASERSEGQAVSGTSQPPLSLKSEGQHGAGPTSEINVLASDRVGSRPRGSGLAWPVVPAKAVAMPDATKPETALIPEAPKHSVRTGQKDANPSQSSEPTAQRLIDMPNVSARTVASDMRHAGFRGQPAHPTTDGLATTVGPSQANRVQMDRAENIHQDLEKPQVRNQLTATATSDATKSSTMLEPPPTETQNQTVLALSRDATSGAAREMGARSRPSPSPAPHYVDPQQAQSRTGRGAAIQETMSREDASFEQNAQARRGPEGTTYLDREATVPRSLTETTAPKVTIASDLAAPSHRLKSQMPEVFAAGDLKGTSEVRQQDRSDQPDRAVSNPSDVAFSKTRPDLSAPRPAADAGPTPAGRYMPVRSRDVADAPEPARLVSSQLRPAVGEDLAAQAGIKGESVVLPREWSFQNRPKPTVDAPTPRTETPQLAQPQTRETAFVADATQPEDRADGVKAEAKQASDGATRLGGESDNPRAQVQEVPKALTVSDPAFAAPSSDPLDPSMSDERTDLTRDVHIDSIATVRRPTVIHAPDHMTKVGDQVAQAVRQASGGPVEITLNPEELGRVRMHLATGDQGVTLIVTAERPETLDLMRRNIDQLAAEYREMGFGTMQFSFGQEGAGGQHSDPGQGKTMSSPHLAEAPVPDATRPLTSVTTGMDIRI